MKTKKNKKYINVTKKHKIKNKKKNEIINKIKNDLVNKYIKKNNKNNNKNIKTRKKRIKKYIKSRKKKYIKGPYEIIENVCYNFSEEYNCRWCGSLKHDTYLCCLNN